MPRKALASLNVVLNAVTSPLFRGLALASKKLIAFGAKMKAIGRSIAMSFTLPFAMIGAAGAKMAVDFERNMTKVNTLVGISKDKVNAFAKDVMKLSGETAQAPADLADGLFFLASAGLRGANAMETLEAVAKGTSIGLGEQTDLAKVAAAAQNAYGEETISASEALDVFGIAVQQGMFEASDLAAVLGTQLGLASSLGISFQEANAFIATYTKTTGDANAASTSFGGVMMALAKITPKQGRALKKIGMDADSLQQMLGDKGLRATLMHLKDSFEQSGVPLTDFFSKSQALKGVLGVLGNQTEVYGDVLDAMGDSAGFVEEGFETLSETAGFRLQKSFTNLKNVAMELGARLMPIFEGILNTFTNLTRAYDKLDEGSKKLIIGAAALVAFSGPLMTLIGGILSGIGLLLSPIGLIILAIGALSVAIYKNWDKIKPLLVDFVNYWIDLWNESEAFRTIIVSIGLAFLTMWGVVKFVFKAAWGFISAFGRNFIELFSSLGDILKGVFTGSWEDIKAGASRAWDAVTSTFGEGWDDTKKAATQLGEDLMNNLHKGIGIVNSKEKIELITEEDVDRSIDTLKTLIGDKWDSVKEYIQSLVGGSMLTMGEDDGGDDGGDGGGEDNSNFVKTIEEKKSILQKYLDWAKDGYEGFADKVGETWAKISKVAGSALNAIAGLQQAQHEKAMAQMNNEKTTEEENLEKDYERELAVIERTIANEDKKEEAITALKEKYDGKKADIDDKFAAKEKALKIKKAKRDKKMAIANAIMGTAEAVVTALDAGPVIGPILAAFVGALGAVQIATIASTPIAMAKGALAFGPVNAIVGDNPGAAHDPEVIAPLSKLRDMMGMNVQLNVGGVVKGSDIWLSNDETGTQRARYI